MLIGMLLKVNITCSCIFPDYIVFMLFTGEIRNLAQIIQPAGYSLWFHCIENIYANIITEMPFFPTLM